MYTANQGGFRNPWAATPSRQPVASSGIGRNFGEVKYWRLACKGHRVSF